jgi:uncharacterized membrane protein YqhA
MVSTSLKREIKCQSQNTSGTVTEQSKRPALSLAPLRINRSDERVEFRHFERQVIVASRFLAAFAVVGALAGAVLMFVLGFYSVYEAYSVWLPWHDGGDPDVRPSASATISIIEALDRFLIAIVVLYFGYGVYSLFIHPEEAEEDLSLPAWLRVSQIGQLKQVVAEVIIVILFVLFLRTALQNFHKPQVVLSTEQILTFAILPICAALLAFALWLVQLHPKPRATDKLSETQPPKDLPRVDGDAP